MLEKLGNWKAETGRESRKWSSHSNTPFSLKSGNSRQLTEKNELELCYFMIVVYVQLTISKPMVVHQSLPCEAVGWALRLKTL